jgi:hypothetical protein
MAKSAKDYSINNPYNPPLHNGIDRPTPSGTQVFPGDDRILTGNTGLSTGPHIHSQSGNAVDMVPPAVINPATLEFKSVVVVKVGTGTQWGKYVTVKVGSKYITYAHLSKNSVKIGDIVGDNMATKYKTKAEVAADYKAIRGVIPPDSTLSYHVGRDREPVLVSLGKEAAKVRDDYKAKLKICQEQPTPPAEEYVEFEFPPLFVKKK